MPACPIRRLHAHLEFTGWNVHDNRNKREEARALRRAGVPPGEIADALDVSRQSVWRWTRGIEPIEGEGAPSAPAREPVNDGAVDWPDLQREQVANLRHKANGGSVTAAAQLLRQAGTEIRSAPACYDHVTRADSDALIQAQFDLWRDHLMGSFTRALAHQFDLRLDMVEMLVLEAVASVAEAWNRKIESALEGAEGE